MFREKVIRYASGLKGNFSTDLQFSANFEIQNSLGKDVFHIVVQNGDMSIKDGLAEKPVLNFSSRENSIMELLELGDDMLEALLTKPFYISGDQYSVPQMEQTFFISSETPRGLPVRYKLGVKNSVICIWEGEEDKTDIAVKIKPSILKELIKGQVNIPLALIKGQIRISNKKEIFRILKTFGMKSF